MKLTCTQPALARALSIVERAVPSKSALPVLSNILFVAENGCLRVSGTNLEIGITDHLDAEIEAEGSITLPAKLFSDLVKQSPAERATLTLSGDKMHYTCGPVNSYIKGLPADDFPLPTTLEGQTIELPAPMLKEMIGQVTFAAAGDDSRPILTGVLMALVPGELEMCATDGFRLSRATAELEGFGNAAFRIVVPARALSELRRIAGDSEEMVRVTVGLNQVRFELDGVVLLSQLIEGNFPEIQRLIPKSYGTAVTIEIGALLKAVRRCQIFARDGANIMRLTIANMGLMIQGEANEIGENEEEVAADVAGEGMEICLNAKYLMEALGNMGGGSVIFEGTSSTTPAVLRPVGDENFKHVIMPMSVNPQR